jgi:serine/threonine protein phosphatase 1
LGDLTDRGPDSRGVIERLLRGIEAGEPWQVIRGNHDRLFSGWMHDPDYRDPSLKPDRTFLQPNVGGDATLASYGVTSPAERDLYEVHRDACEKVDAEHLRFLDRLPDTVETDELLFVHAGLRPGIPLAEQSAHDLLSIREPFHSDRSDHGWLVVHGHSPIERVTHYGNRINLDTDAGHGGPLSAVVFEGREAFLLTEEGRRPILPEPLKSGSS